MSDDMSDKLSPQLNISYKNHNMIYSCTLETFKQKMILKNILKILYMPGQKLEKCFEK